jgi:cytoskeletal protein RodZ
MSSTPFGEHLKREREMRGVTIEEISAATRISTRFLEALESEQWDELPGGVFNRGFIRSVARFLGLDEDALVAEYALETKNRPSPRMIELETPSAMPRSWQPAIAAAAVFVLLMIGGWFIYNHFGARIGTLLHRRASAPPSSEPTPSSLPSPSSTPAPPAPGDSH